MTLNVKIQSQLHVEAVLAKRTLRVCILLCNVPCNPYRSTNYSVDDRKQQFRYNKFANATVNLTSVSTKRSKRYTNQIKAPNLDPMKMIYENDNENDNDI